MIQDLPVELIIRIFEFVVLVSDENDEPCPGLSHINSRLRQIIIDTPTFWTEIEIDVFDSGTIDQAHAYLARTKSLPINLFVLLITSLGPYSKYV